MGLATLTFGSDALALDPPRTAHVVQLGGGFRYGLSLDDPTPDPWGPGLGLELGYTTGDAFYFGTVFDYFFGERTQIAGLDLSANLWQLAAEGGYDFQLSEAVLVRPKLGVGAATVRVDCSNCVGIDPSTSETKLAAAPGLTAMFFAGSVILSVDTRFQMVFAEETMKALVFSFGIGF
jgi:hypothetical protein